MARERARRRAEREAAQAREREVRARRRVRRERVERVRSSVTSALPDRPKVAPGVLARRRRRRLFAFVLGVIAIQVLVWPFVPSWTGRLVVLVPTLLAAPVVWVLSFGRV